MRHEHPSPWPCTVPDRNMCLPLLPQWVSPCQSEPALACDRNKEAFCKEIRLRGVCIHQLYNDADWDNSPNLAPCTTIRMALTLGIGNRQCFPP
jgi:hypothetical protein